MLLREMYIDEFKCDSAANLNLVQVRRKADPAKSLVKVWVKDWRDSPSISRETSYTEISGIDLLRIAKIPINPLLMEIAGNLDLTLF